MALGGAVAAPPISPGSIPTGPFVAAAESGDLAVGFAAQPAGAGRVRITATVIGPDGAGASGVLVDVTLASRHSESAPTASCGPGCFRATLPLAGAPREALVRIRRLGHLSARVRFTFPAAWPPLPGTGIARAATRTFTSLTSVTFRETLRSNPASAVRTRWVFEAPDRLSYATDEGPQGVISGSRRWDRLPGTAWVESPQAPIRQPEAPWGAVAPRRATLLGGGVFRGHRVWRVAFVDPQVPAWYTATVEIGTYRTLALQMVAPAHFMSHVYSGFNAAPQILPPLP